jgi:hypothetical protein
MSDSLIGVRSSETPVFESLPRGGTFLVESQRRVIGHCRRRLKAQDLAPEHRQRLTRLVGLSEAELQRLLT